MLLSMSTQVFALTENEILVEDLIEQLNLEGAAPGEESESISLIITQEADPTDPPTGILGVKISPFVAGTIGSRKMGIFNLSAGLDARYFATDITVGLGAFDSSGTNSNDGALVKSFSAALRLKITSFLEIGGRFMNQGFTADSDKTALRLNNYTSSLKSFGYDIRGNIPLTPNGKVSAIINITGLKKGSLDPNFVQAGLKFNL